VAPLDKAVQLFICGVAGRDLSADCLARPDLGHH
jgi:hypothetical protein